MLFKAPYALCETMQMDGLRLEVVFGISWRVGCNFEEDWEELTFTGYELRLDREHNIWDVGSSRRCFVLLIVAHAAKGSAINFT